MKLFPQADAAAFLQFDHERHRTEVVAELGYDLESFNGCHLTPEEATRRYSERAELLEEGVYLIKGDVFHELAGSEQTKHFRVPKSMLAMEVSLGGRIEGFLIFDNFTDPDAFGRERSAQARARPRARHLRDFQGAHPARAAAQESRGRGGQSGQEPLPGQHEPRAAHADERHHRLLRNPHRAAGSADRREVDHLHPLDPQLRQAPARDHQRHPRPLESRSGQDGAAAGDVPGAQRDRERLPGDARDVDAQGDHVRGRDRAGRDGDRDRSGQVQADPLQPAVERGEVFAVRVDR